MGAPGTLRGMPRALLGAFCVYHMGAALVSNMPSSTAFGGELRAPFEPYVKYAGLWQSWTMFTTIPYFRAIRPVLVARTPGGTQTEYDAVLPGLARYRQNNRLTALFVRYTFPAGDVDGYARGYVRNACDAIEAATGARPQSVGLRLDSDRLLPLDRVRSSGRMSAPSSDLSSASGSCD